MRIINVHTPHADKCSIADWYGMVIHWGSASEQVMSEVNWLLLCEDYDMNFLHSAQSSGTKPSSGDEWTIEMIFIGKCQSSQGGRIRSERCLHYGIFSCRRSLGMSCLETFWSSPSLSSSVASSVGCGRVNDGDHRSFAFKRIAYKTNIMITWTLKSHTENGAILRDNPIERWD